MDVFKRDDLGFPTFWTLQIIGWGCVYLSALISLLSFLKRPGALSALVGSSIFVAALFCASCALRPFCRSLVKRGLSWIALELRGILYSLLAGAAAGTAIQLADLRNSGFDWINWIQISMQSGFMLFFWCSLYFSIKLWQQSIRERERLLRAEGEARDARLSALRYQLNPHFLFNSLNAVSTLVLEGNPPAATRMLAQIGEFLRTILDNEAAPETPLSQEIAFAEQYLAIEQTRLGPRLRVDMDIAPETLEALVPSMLLQPLIENAVRHGVAPIVDGGTIRIASKLHGAKVEIKVQNSGPLSPRLSRTSDPANGIGISNTAERLKTLYATDHQFLLQWPEAGGCEVTVELPFRKSLQPQGEAPCAR